MKRKRGMLEGMRALLCAPGSLRSAPEKNARGAIIKSKAAARTQSGGASLRMRTSKNSPQEKGSVTLNFSPQQECAAPWIVSTAA